MSNNNSKINGVQIFSIGCFVIAFWTFPTLQHTGALITYFLGVFLLALGAFLARKFHFGRELSTRATIVAVMAPFILGGFYISFGAFFFALSIWIGRDLWESDAGKELESGRRKMNPFHLAGFLLMEGYFLFQAGCEDFIWGSKRDFDFGAQFWPVFGIVTTILIIVGLIYRLSHRQDRSLDGIASGLMLFLCNFYLLDYIFPSP